MRSSAFLDRALRFFIVYKEVPDTSLPRSRPSPEPTSRRSTSPLEKVLDCTVTIYVEDGQGSGVIVDPRGFLVTNKHVVGYARTATVMLASGEEFECRVLRSSRARDLALLSPTSPGRTYPCLSIGGYRPQPGQTVFAVGSPSGLHGTVTKGIVSHPGREIGGQTWIQVDAAVNSGNSGGPLVDEQGVLLGINTFGRRDTQGINFASPVNGLLGWAQELDRLVRDSSRVSYCPTCGGCSTLSGRYCPMCGACASSSEILASGGPR